MEKRELEEYAVRSSVTGAVSVSKESRLAGPTWEGPWSPQAGLSSWPVLANVFLIDRRSVDGLPISYE